MTPATRLTLLRLIPIAVLVLTALATQAIFGTGRGTAAIVGLAAAITSRLALTALWRER